MTKTEFMVIGSTQKISTLKLSPAFAMSDFLVTKVYIGKSLAVTYDDNLYWGSHIKT